jgi:GalNAc-alpha-(1->4)-GalNAc-alpha-(1->3)-diNAcBac-PP-undecaprenol alpha-1,4-N-acetyl-D-galactosaminyltransferase
MPHRGTMRPRRITLVIASLQAGGAERVMSMLANHWTEHGRDVTLITLAAVDTDFYALHPGVRRVGLGLIGSSSHPAAAMKSNLRRLRRLRREIKRSQPNVVVSFLDQTNVLALAASRGSGTPVIACEHTDPRQHELGPAWRLLRSLLYPRAAALVILTEGVRPWAERLVKSDRVLVIPNPVPVSAVKAGDTPDQGESGRTIAAMGQLAPRKGFDLLLAAFGRCANKHADWSLVILGEGEERRRLEALAGELGIESRVSLPGRVQDPATVLRQADLFVLASRYEGFPMALLEAMACGLAVISTDCPSGPREIVRDGVDAVLVPPHDVDALAAAMDRLMGDGDERERLGTHAVGVIERFDVGRIMDMWNKLFEQATQPRT